MLTDNGFPRELLSHSVQARKKYFEDKFVKHARLEEKHRELMDYIHEPAGVSLVFVVGPTGVGKTTLLHGVVRQLTEEAMPDLERDRGRIPVFAIEAATPEARGFDWADFYIRCLTGLHEPLIGHKIDYGETEGLRTDQEGRLVIHYNARTRALRRTLEKCLIHRKLAALIVDEAQDFQKVSGGRRLLDQMDTLKSLTSLSHTLWVLVGHYELLTLIDLNGQLSRRSREIHFTRYRYECEEDTKAFRGALLTFQSHLPLEREPNLLKHWEYLYEHSLGCVGIIKDWLRLTLAAALEDDEKKPFLSYLRKYQIPPRKLVNMAREIREGEIAMEEKEAQRAELRRLLNMSAEPVRKSMAETGDASKPATARSEHRSRAVGKRNPQRDPVGVQSYVE
jgi:GTPase SAR1 family protein